MAVTISRASARPRLSVISISVRFIGAASHKPPGRRAHGWAPSVVTALDQQPMGVMACQRDEPDVATAGARAVHRGWSAAVRDSRRRAWWELVVRQLLGISLHHVVAT